MSKKIIDGLNRLAEFKETADAVFEEYRQKRNKLLEDVQPQLNKLTEKYRPIFVAFQEKINAIEIEIRIETLKCGQSVRGDKLMASIAKGKESIDAEFVAICKEEHPEVELFRSLGLPSVSIRSCEK